MYRLNKEQIEEIHFTHCKLGNIDKRIIFTNSHDNVYL